MRRSKRGTQVAGRALDVVKLLPPPIMDERDVRWFLDSFEEVMEDLHRFPSPAWEAIRRVGASALGRLGERGIREAAAP